MKKAQEKVYKSFAAKRSNRFVFGWLLLSALLALSPHTYAAASGVQFSPAGKTPENAVTGKWRAEFIRENGRDELLFSFENSSGAEQDLLNREFAVGELKNLTGEQISGATANVDFMLEREAGVLRCRGVFQNGKGEGNWSFAPNQAFVSSLRANGYDAVTENDLFRAALDNVTTAFVEDLKSLGFDRLEFHRILTAANLGVTADFIREMHFAGYRNSAIEDINTAKNRGITPDFISSMRAAGFDQLSIAQLAALKNLKVTPEFVSDLKAEGFRDISPEIVVRLRNHRIDRAYIQRVRGRGFADATLDQIIKLRNLNIVK